MNLKGLAAAAILAAPMLQGCGESTAAAISAPQAVMNGPVPPNLILDADPTCPSPRCFDVEIPVPGGVTVTDVHVRVILPLDYGTIPGKRHPVLYLMHDAPGTYQIWTQRTDIVELSRAFDAIIVMPDGGHGENAGWYTDWQDGSRQWETFHIGVMIPYLDQHLATNGRRAIAGASMGGFGSMSYSARHPGMFLAAGSISGAVDLLYLSQLSAEVAALINPIISTPDASHWGDPLTNYAEWQAHDPGSNVQNLVGMKIYLTAGNGTPGGAYDDLVGPTQAGYYVVENIVWQMGQSFAATLEGAAVDHRTFFYGPGFHDWPYYREELVWLLPQLMAAIR